MNKRWLRAAALLAIGTLAAIIYSYSSPDVKAEAAVPPILHPTAGQEKCLTCHSSGAVKPAPASHAAYGEGICLACHSVAAQTPAPATPTPSQESTAAPGATPPEAPAGLTKNSACFACHGQPGLSMTLANGDKLPLCVDPRVLAASVHGDMLLCTDCHTSISGYPHPKREIAGRRAYNIAQYDLCKRCHFVNYTKTLDSIHYTTQAQGDLKAPLCTDCHGAHNVASPDQPRSRVSRTCSQCHDAIYIQYVGSVHGKALIEDNNQDVPVCTDCHRSHNIEDPRTAAFRIESVNLCGSCHVDEKLMAKYGLSTRVLKTYLQDFHGQTVSLMAQQSKDIWVKEPVCTDCHGVHDIQKVDNPDSPVIKVNLVNTCRKCHPDATANFSGAWLSHYEPGLHQAQLVFFVRGFYWVLIPFILLGLSVHILLDVWKAITNR